MTDGKLDWFDQSSLRSTRYKVGCALEDDDSGHLQTERAWVGRLCDHRYGPGFARVFGPGAAVWRTRYETIGRRRRSAALTSMQFRESPQPWGSPGLPTRFGLVSLDMNIGRSANQSLAALVLASCGALCLGSCSTMDVHTASDSQLSNRRNEINRKIAEDDFGMSFGPTRWVSHATERNKDLKEKARIDAELSRRRRAEKVGIARRQPAAPNVTIASAHNPPKAPGEGPSSTVPSDSQFPLARRVPNKPGFVFSPSDPSKYVDVSGYASGSKVKDPYSGEIFTVP